MPSKQSIVRSSRFYDQHFFDERVHVTEFLSISVTEYKLTNINYSQVLICLRSVIEYEAQDGNPGIPK